MTDWPVAIGGREFQPIPKSWIDAGDDSGQVGKRVYAVSCAVSSNAKLLSIRYAHPVSGCVLLTTTGAEPNPTGDGVVPGGLARGTGWPRCKTPHPDVEPAEPLRDPEWSHLEDLWAERLGLEAGDDRGRLVADGGPARNDPSARDRTGVNPDAYLDELATYLSAVEANPLRSTLSSRDAAEALGLSQSQATSVLQRAAQEGLVERRGGPTIPKWVPLHRGRSA